MHAVRFCVNEMREKNWDPNKTSQYLEQMDINSQRATELIDSLRLYLRNPDHNKGQISNVPEAFVTVNHLLLAQAQNESLNKINFVIDEALQNISFDIPMSDLIHILYNLTKNSVQNFSDHKMEQPQIKIELIGVDTFEQKSFVEFMILDNGSGLSRHEYEQLTQYRVSYQDAFKGRKGLGLKMTRRLIERHQGSIQLAHSDQGTIFNITLPGKRNKEG